MDRALRFGRRGWGFDSLQARKVRKELIVFPQFAKLQKYGSQIGKLAPFSISEIIK